MLAGLMQNAPLLTSGILSYAANAHSDREIVSVGPGLATWRYDYARCATRVAQTSNMIEALGVAPGMRVSSLAWNNHRHFELFYAVSGSGSVLHTANPRLSDDHIAFTINHAESAILFFDSNLLPLVERLRPRLETVTTYICLADDGYVPVNTLNAEDYESLIAQQAGERDWPSFDENSAAILCYTTGTTGLPKGVLYSHRSIVLHALAGGLDSAFGLSAFDCVMPCSSLYHATAWGLPFMAPIQGCKLVLPGDRMDGASLHSLIVDEGVTFTGGVPTIWSMYLAHIDQIGERPGKLDRVVIGGSAVPRAMADRFEHNYGVKVRQIWGMTEISPMGVMSTPTPKVMAQGASAANEILWSRQGRLQFGVEMKVVEESGREAPRDGNTPGTIHVRGPWTISSYYRQPEPATDKDGWFDTGDIGTIDSLGFLRITDRAKDIIKSGGEWISSIDLENAAIGYSGVRVAAVVGVHHPKWEERPLLVVEPHPGIEVTGAEILAYLEGKVVKWWIPDEVIVETIPLNANGKIDKAAIRKKYGGFFIRDASIQSVPL